MSEPDLRRYQVQFAAEGIDLGVLRVVRLQIDEDISFDARCQIWTVCDIGVIEPRMLLGKPAVVAILLDDGSVVRRFHGNVRAGTEGATSVLRRQSLRLTLGSPLENLADSSDYRIFQNQTTKDIVDTLLQENGVAAANVEWRAASSPKRITCTQYGETARAFAERLLEEDGVYWFVEHGDEGAKLIFGDSAANFSDLGEAKLAHRAGFGISAREFVTKVADRARVRPAKVTLRDHDFTKPTLKLESITEVTTALGREHYQYPGLYGDEAGGKARAETISAAQVADAKQVHFVGQALSMVAGHVRELADTPDGQFDGKYVPVRLRQEWSQGDGGQAATIDTEAWLLKADQRFAPLDRTPRPRARGDLAMVSVPAGDEIHCDEHGRIRVQYHWDRRGQQDDKSSGWTRVSQMHTSGSVVIPRRSWEVLVEFEDGDPEHPIVIGRLYNGAAPPTDPLPGGKSNSALTSYSTPGGGGKNEIRMNDGGGGELVNVHAQKDMNLVVANNKTEEVATTANIAVGVNHSMTVGASQTETVGADEEVTVGGSQTHKVGGSRTKTVSGGETHDVAGSRSMSIGANHTTMTAMSASTSTNGSLTETVGGMCLEAAALGVGLAVAGSTSISVGAAKIEAVAKGKTDMTIGARATTIGGAFINATPKDIGFTTKGIKVTTVGGAWLGNAGGKAELSSQANISITVGGVVAMNAAKIVLKVGGSTVTIAAGSVILDSQEVALKASGPAAELAAGVASK